MARKKNEALERLESEFKNAEKEMEEKKQLYLREKYKADTEIIRNALLEKTNPLSFFASLRVAEKKMVAEMFADHFVAFMSSSETQTAIAESEAKYDEEVRRRKEKRLQKEMQQAQSSTVYQSSSVPNQSGYTTEHPGY